MKYTYPAVFVKEENGYAVSFPDLDGCYTCGDTLQEAVEMAEDALCLMLYNCEEDGDPIPPPSKESDFVLEDDGSVHMISCDTEFYRDYFKK